MGIEPPLEALEDLEAVRNTRIWKRLYRSGGGRNRIAVQSTGRNSTWRLLLEISRANPRHPEALEAAEDKAKKAEVRVQKPGAEALAQKRSSTNARWCNLALDEDKAKEAEVPLRELDRAKIRALRTQKRSAEEARLQEAGYINGKPKGPARYTEVQRYTPQWSTTATAKVRPTEKSTKFRKNLDLRGWEQREKLQIQTQTTSSWCQGMDPRGPSVSAMVR